jgi:hypothetical protein
MQDLLFVGWGKIHCSPTEQDQESADPKISQQGGDVPDNKEKWEPPTITPLPRLGEQTAPTTFTASSPEMLQSSLDDVFEILELVEKGEAAAGVDAEAEPQAG